jgi:nucleotide-binding universal stress UspA family protein
MTGFKKILCPVDFFPASDAAANYAAGLAANCGAGIHLLHVVTPVVTGGYEYSLDTREIMTSLRKKAEEELSALARKCRETGINTEHEVCVGDVYDEIKMAIEDLKPEVVVMGTHGRRGVERWFMGSTTEKVMRHSPVPLITINAAGEKVSPPRFSRILVTTDFSEGTSDALAYAFSVAQENQSKITLLHVIHDVAANDTGKYRESLIFPGMVEGVEEQLKDLVPAEATPWCDVSTQVEVGIPYRIILRVLEDQKIDLLVMNIHGKGMLDRALLGSTAERVVRIAPCPVMLIPPQKKISGKARPGGTRTAA